MHSIKRDRIQAIAEMIADYFSAIVAWTLYYTFRKLYLEPLKFGHEVNLEFNLTFFLGLAIIPVFWLVLYHISGAYFDIYRKSRLGVLGTTLWVNLIGSIILFFAVSLDDIVLSYEYYYWSFAALFSIQFFITAVQRIIIGTNKARRIQQNKISFNTILVGSGNKAYDIYKTIENQAVKSGNNFIGFVPVNGSDNDALKATLPCIGEFKEMVELIKEKDVEEVIVAPENSEHKYLGKFLTELEVTNVVIKVIPDITDFLLGSVRMSAIFGAPVIELKRQLMPPWQKSLKRLFDISISILVLTLLSPVYLITALIVKTTSKGPALYSHYRIGFNGKPFKIYKFRSMY